MGILDVLDRIFVKKNFNLYSVSRLDDLFNRKIVDIDKIVEYIEKKYSENSNCVDLFSKLAYYFLQKDDLYSAKKYLDKDSKLKRQSWWSTIRYAEYFALKGNINKSFEIIDKIYEENCEAMNGYGHVGWILYRKGKISYIDVCDILKKDIDKNRLSNGFKIIAASIFGINNLFFAQELVWEAYREDDFLKDGFSLLALNLMRNKDYALALDFFRRDESLGRMSAVKRLNYAELLGILGEIEEAKEQVEKAYREDDFLKDGFSLLALNLMRNKDYALALDFFRRDESLGRMSAVKRLNYAELLGILGEIEEAKEQVEKAYREDKRISGGLSLLLKSSSVFEVVNLFSLACKEDKNRYFLELYNDECFSVFADRCILAYELKKAEKRYGYQIIEQFNAIEDMLKKDSSESNIIEVLGFKVKVLNIYDALVQFREIFLQENYYFYYNSSIPPFIIDGGSNCGLSIAYFKYLYPNSTIIAFEPNPIAYEICKENIERNKWKDVTIYPYALYNKKGIKKMNIFPKMPMGSSLIDRKYNKTLMENYYKNYVKTVKLSDYIGRHVDFLKLDIEGAENFVFNDIKDNFAKYFSNGFIEYHYENENGLSLILDVLESNGFDYNIYNNLSKKSFKRRDTSLNSWSINIVFRKKKEVEVIDTRFYHFEKPIRNVLDILCMNQREWNSLSFYVRVHINELYSILNDLDIYPENILEWGSGYSTYLLYYFSKKWKSKSIVTIDDNCEYQKNILQKLYPYPSLLNVKCLSQIGEIWPWDYEEYNYSTYPRSLKKKFDLIFIDGRRRNECMLTSYYCLSSKGILILHDSWRKRYKVGMKMFKKIKKLDEYVILKKG